MESLRNLIDIIESVEDSEDEYLTPPETGDDFAIEIDDYCLESHIIHSSHEHLVLECDDRGMAILESAGCTLVDEPLDEAKYQGRTVDLNKPMAGDVAKFKVYVKDPKTGNVKKVNFGQKGVKIKKNNPARRKSFRARHKCATAKDKTSARYWSCRKW
jgi:hypothetical protein